MKTVLKDTPSDESYFSDILIFVWFHFFTQVNMDFEKYYCFRCGYNHYVDTQVGRLHRPENIEKTKRSVFDLEMFLPVKRSDKYHSKYPNVDIFIKEMSPDEYLDEILKYERLKINHEELQKVKNFYMGINIPEKLGRYAYDMKRLRNNPVFTRGIDKFPMVMLERNSVGQTVANDGVHRVFAAKMAGIKQIPVYIVQEKPRQLTRA